MSANADLPILRVKNRVTGVTKLFHQSGIHISIGNPDSFEEPIITVSLKFQDGDVITYPVVDISFPIRNLIDPRYDREGHMNNLVADLVRYHHEVVHPHRWLSEIRLVVKPSPAYPHEYEFSFPTPFTHGGKAQGYRVVTGLERFVERRAATAA